ncbi:Uncharacterised protein [Listeria grayi]|uniref:Uncharacterized protein n=1 Tax=Listeria grayi TaxID=1641 RepID=A0A378MHL6_LISGR|nr:Uncharacterised protein [Listeria grayi]
MNLFKKVALLSLLTLSFALLLAACGQKNSDTSSSNNSTASKKLISLKRVNYLL